MAIAKSDMIRSLVPVFRRYGYEGTTMARISKASGLGRASLYHHFPDGKQEIAKAVLAYVNEWFGATVLAPLEKADEPIKRLEAMCESLSRFYDRGQDACLLAIFSVGESQDLFHLLTQKALRAWLDKLTQVLSEMGLGGEQARQRAEDAVMQIQGALVLTRVLDSSAPFERVLEQLPEKLIRDGSKAS